MESHAIQRLQWPSAQHRSSAAAFNTAASLSLVNPSRSLPEAVVAISSLEQRQPSPCTPENDSVQAQLLPRLPSAAYTNNMDRLPRDLQATTAPGRAPSS